MFCNKIKYRLLDLDLKKICEFKSKETKQLDEFIIYDNNLYKIRQIISDVNSITNIVVSFEKKIVGNE
jgi:hypothetical protein